MKIGMITLGKHTASHAASLRRLGYEVTEDPACIKVAVSEFLPAVDFTGPDAKGLIRKMVEARQAFTYTTKAIVPAGSGGLLKQEISNFALCRYLGPLSCLVMNDLTALEARRAAQAARAQPPVGITIDDLVK